MSAANPASPRMQRMDSARDTVDKIAFRRLKTNRQVQHLSNPALTAYMKAIGLRPEGSAGVRRVRKAWEKLCYDRAKTLQEKFGEDDVLLARSSRLLARRRRASAHLIRTGSAPDGVEKVGSDPPTLQVKKNGKGRGRHRRSQSLNVERKPRNRGENPWFSSPKKAQDDTMASRKRVPSKKRLTARSATSSSSAEKKEQDHGEKKDPPSPVAVHGTVSERRGAEAKKEIKKANKPKDPTCPTSVLSSIRKSKKRRKGRPRSQSTGARPRKRSLDPSPTPGEGKKASGPGGADWLRGNGQPKRNSRRGWHRSHPQEEKKKSSDPKARSMSMDARPRRKRLMSAGERKRASARGYEEPVTKRETEAARRGTGGRVTSRRVSAAANRDMGARLARDQRQERSQDRTQERMERPEQKVEDASPAVPRHLSNRFQARRSRRQRGGSYADETGNPKIEVPPDQNLVASKSREDKKSPAEDTSKKHSFSGANPEKVERRGSKSSNKGAPKDAALGPDGKAKEYVSPVSVLASIRASRKKPKRGKKKRKATM